METRPTITIAGMRPHYGSAQVNSYAERRGPSGLPAKDKQQFVGAERDMLLVGQVSNAVDAVAEFRRHRPDISLLDLRPGTMAQQPTNAGENYRLVKV